MPRRASAPGSLAVLLAAGVMASGCGTGDRPGSALEGSALEGSALEGSACEGGEPVELDVEVIEEVPHDPTAFTQGLVLGESGELFESTGGEGESSLRLVDVATGEVIRSVSLDEDLFGEGLAPGEGGELVQLTWKDRKALRWDPDSFELLGDFDYEGEGWGLARVDEGIFAMSDGTNELTLRSTTDFAVLDTVAVEREGGGADRLNELEWDGEHLWANRWQTDEVLRIDLECARVDAVLDASVLRERAEEVAGAAAAGMDVLNGIADLGGGELLLAGKRWPVSFRVRPKPSG